MKKLLSLMLSLLLILGMVSALAEEAPVELTFWTFQEIHTQFMQGQLDRWNADPDKPKITLDMQVYPYED
ncbi:MAG: arabinose-binding protein, partial [Clostridiales bacterium]|nr:arabinose-binding protein [Clostridiales bacterium]